METSVKILSGISDEEKGAYLSAIASIATADSEASDLEIEHLLHLCEAADLPADQQEMVIAAAKGTNDSDLVRSLDILKSSDLKYSLVTDLFAFAKSDGNYSEAEQQSVKKIANYLGVDDKQYGLLGELADQTNATSPGAANEGGMMNAFGLGDKLKASGINGGGLLKGLVSIAAPLIIAKMMGRNRSSGSSSGGLGGLLGGLTGGNNAGAGSGGLGGLLGGLTGGGSGGAGNGGLLGGGGLGSLIGMLNGGKGMGAAGGLLGRIFG